MKTKRQKMTWSSVGTQALAFLIHVTDVLRIRPLTKYTALSFFGDRFLRDLQSQRHAAENDVRSRWIDPQNESNLQLLALVSLWIASKIHETRPIFLGSLKSIADELITDQHFTTRDFIEAELAFMKVINFNLGTRNIIFLLLENLLLKFRDTAVIAEELRSRTCLDIIDSIYESEDLTLSILSNGNLAASAILAAAYVLTVPRRPSEFPLLPWLKIMSECEENDIKAACHKILMHILQFPQ